MSEAILILVVLALWTAVLTAVAAVRRLIRGRPSEADAELDELRARYARGEIPYAAYDERRRDLRAAGPPARERPGALGTGRRPR